MNETDIEYKRTVAERITRAIRVQCPGIVNPEIMMMQDASGEDMVACVDQGDHNRVLFSAASWTALNEVAFIDWCNYIATRRDGKLGISPF